MSLFSKLKDGLKGVRDRLSSLFGSEPFDDAFWEELEEALIAGDVGASLSEEIVRDMRAEAKKSGITIKSALRESLAANITARLSSVPGMGRPFEPDPSRSPLVLLMVGVNGSGKTTSAGKLAAQFTRDGKRVVLAAADTFRAAAAEQLITWGERAGARVVSQKQGSDPAAVAFDAWRSALADHADVLIVDTAGRLQAKHNLMEELRKIHRVLEREAGSERLRVVLTLDAVMGQNGLVQAETFGQALPLSAVILAKYDNTAKGGIVLPIACGMGVPVRYVGLGEGIDDLSPFDPAEFAAALMKEGE
ncbi:MAG: signal recognition particle-docking protein FtsY [Synergistaceae bacterium]|jgi:fused signal recognition particle receptor|nr:signal recognition particle-docking protein FtsY [Synergistaceae bacterium]